MINPMKDTNNKEIKDSLKSDEHKEIVKEAAILGAQDQNNLTPPTTEEFIERPFNEDEFMAFAHGNPIPPTTDWVDTPNEDLALKITFILADFYDYDRDLMETWTKIKAIIAEERTDLTRTIRDDLMGKLIIPVNPSNDDQRDWYRGLGKEEQAREIREKVEWYFKDRFNV